MFVPSPSLPAPLPPQQLTDPSSRITQVWTYPADIATAVRPVPRLEVWVGVYRLVVFPSPSWPEVPVPQQLTEPSSRMAQLCVSPDEIATAVRPVPKLETGVGVFRSVVVPSPISPSTFHPQQLTDPSSRIAQA